MLILYDPVQLFFMFVFHFMTEIALQKIKFCQYDFHYFFIILGAQVLLFLDSAYRQPEDEADLPNIPVHPISNGDAYIILRCAAISRILYPKVLRKTLKFIDGLSSYSGRNFPK